MELKLTPNNKNNYPLGGVLIKSSSPKVWLQEIQNMEISLQDCEAFAIPSTVANKLYGCLILVSNLKVNNLGRNVPVQNIEDKLFIASNSKIAPAVSEKEWHSIFPEYAHFLHPEIGLFELNNPINWAEVLGTIKRVSIKITAPAKSVFIPEKIKSLRVEVDEEALLKEIENPVSEEEMIAKLPFDMQKLLNGNEREMEKFLAFMEKNPELALKYALPLDTLGTFRGDNKGTFSFGGGNFWDSIVDFFSFKNKTPGYSKARNIFSKLLSIGFVLLGFYLIYSLFSYKSAINDGGKPFLEGISTTQFVVKLFVSVMVFIFLGLLITSNLAIKLTSNVRNMIIMFVILLFALYNVVGGLYDDNETNIFFSIAIVALVGVILYRVFNANTTLSKDAR